ncbi:MAG: D-aminoacyl-tRNA deacylase [Candidatus Sumerlaeia bacterium]
MRVLIQRVSEGHVQVEERETGRIGRGLLLLVGISDSDDESVFEPMARKILNMRIFPDPEGDSHFHRSALEEKAELLVVSQFTLYADCRKGRRPSFSHAAPPDRADALFETFVEGLRTYGLKVQTGEFGAMMDVSLINHGPVTIWLDSEDLSRNR